MAYPRYPQTYKKDIQVGDKTITVEIGKFSEQVSAAVLATCGETVVHTTVALGRKVNLGYFPLSVEFAEKLYASGIIKGSRWVKRDGRPTDDTILEARVIDRSLRPLFPDGLTHEVQVINTVFSYDGENDPDMLGMVASALGVMLSEIPFQGPLAGIRVGYSKATGSFTVNPTNTQQKESDLDLVVSGSGNAIVMVEAGANEIPEVVMIDALGFAQEELGKVCTQLEAIVAEIGKPKAELVSAEDTQNAQAIEAMAEKIYAAFTKEIRAVVEKEGVLAPETGMSELKEKAKEMLTAALAEGEELNASHLSEALHTVTKRMAREMIISEKTRPDGRKTDEIRQIWCEVDVFPRTHGSAMFKRGATQALTITTLGSPSLGQLIEGIDGEETRHYIHHYSMPPYASGEAGRFGAPKRREIGHGALAERALLPVLPAHAEFPYTMHVVSEIVSSNGSTSQASVCGSTLSLMAAGVPIKRPVAGIAMGLMSDGAEYVVLSDIQGLEDHVGDMDFKVAGTAEGITAIQMDIKLTGIPKSVLVQALEQAKVGRLHILDQMLAVLSAPRTELSSYAPKVKQLRIPAEKIGELIGPGGKMIKSLIEMTGAQIDVDEDEETNEGVVNISSSDQAQIDHAYQTISNMMRTVDVGDEFDGTVTRVEAYGAFVEYLTGREGLVHVSAMSTEYVQSAEELLKVGDSVHVRVSGFKDDGKIQLSMLTPEQEAAARERGGNSGGDRGGHRGGGDRGGFRPRRDNGGRPPFRGGRR